MKNYLKITLTMLSALFAVVSLSAQISNTGVNKAAKPTEKGFIDKKSIFDPAALDSLLKCDDYVMLISSYEGCGPCEWLRTSDVFDRYPVSPYYTDYLLNGGNETVPYTFYVSGFPTCFFFDNSGKIVAVTMGTTNYYEKLDRIINNKENFCEHKIKGIDDAMLFPFFNFMHNANTAYLRGDMEAMYSNVSEAMNIFPYFYNRYLLYKYYEASGDTESAEQYKTLALENMDQKDKYIFKKLIAELKGEEQTE